jgi:ribosomal protein L40E
MEHSGHLSMQTADNSSTSGRRQKILLSVAGVALIGAGLVWYFFGGGGHFEPNSWNATLQCSKCGYRFNGNAKLTFPVEAQVCPKCGAKAAWEVKYCSACKLVFLPKLVGDPPRPEAMPVCPKCGSNQHVGAYVPGVSDKSVEGE